MNKNQKVEEMNLVYTYIKEHETFPINLEPPKNIRAVYL